MKFDEYLAERRQRVDAALERLIPAADAPPATIHAAMRHSLFAGGKRIRPVLAIAAAEALGADAVRSREHAVAEAVTVAGERGVILYENDLPDHYP